MSLYRSFLILVIPRKRDFAGHSMVLDSTSKVLYIFAGQREEKYLSDMYAYDIKTGVAKKIFSNFSSAGGPDACFTQRAVIDPNLKELYVQVTLYLRIQGQSMLTALLP